MTTLEEAPAQAAHQSERLWVRPRGPGSRQCLRRVSRPDSLRSEDSEGRMGRRGTFWPGARTSLPGSSVAPEAPQEGPLRPAFRAQNALKKHPCGAESRGGGGAPPTHLILLRNQRAAVRSRAAAPHTPDRPTSTPPSTTQECFSFVDGHSAAPRLARRQRVPTEESGPGPTWGLVKGLVVTLGGEGRLRNPPFGTGWGAPKESPIRDGGGA